MTEVECVRCGVLLDAVSCRWMLAVVSDGVLAHVPVCGPCWGIHFDKVM